MCRGLTFSQRGAAAAGGVGRVERLDDDALVAGGQRGVEVRPAASPRSPVTARGDAQRLGHGGGERRRPPRQRRVEQVLAVEVQHVEEHGVSDARRRCADAMREAVTWNGSGRPSARRAIASPSSTTLRAGSASAAATTSGSRAGDVVQACG